MFLYLSSFAREINSFPISVVYLLLFHAVPTLVLTKRTPLPAEFDFGNLALLTTSSVTAITKDVMMVAARHENGNITLLIPSGSGSVSPIFIGGIR